MFSLDIRKTQSIVIAVAAVFCCGALKNLNASSVTFAASGTFTYISGLDKFKLANEPFSFSVAASPTLVPKLHGTAWAAYSPLKMSATVTSGLTNTQTTLSNTKTTILLMDADVLGSPDSGGKSDTFQLATPIAILGLNLTIKANLSLPDGTLANLHVHPFPSVTLTPSIATITYSDGTNTTVLGINGTFQAVASALASPVAVVHLESAGAEAITVHQDGSKSVRPIHAAPVDLSTPGDRVLLQFYATGVRDASEISVRVAGQDVPLEYFGASGYYPGLDEVTVHVPPSMAGMGEVEVALTVDGRTSNPVNVRIQ